MELAEKRRVYGKPRARVLFLPWDLERNRTICGIFCKPHVAEKVFEGYGD